MKKFAAGILALSMMVLLVFALNGGFDDVDTNKISGMNEASFTMPLSGSGATDATAYLVGEYEGQDGSHLSFDGLGTVKLRDAAGLSHSGRCSLMQNADRSAVLQIILSDGSETVYAYTQTSAEGCFDLTTSNGDSCSYTPVLG